MANGTTKLVSGNIPDGATGQEGQRIYLDANSNPVLVSGGEGQTTTTSTLLVSKDMLATSIPSGVLASDTSGNVTAKGIDSTTALTVANPTSFTNGLSATSAHGTYTATLDNAKGGLFVSATQPASGTSITVGGGIALGYPASDTANAPYYTTLGQFSDAGVQKLALHVRGSANDDITKSFVFTSGSTGTLYLPSGDEVATVSMLKNISTGSGSSGGTVTGDYLPLSGGTLTGDLNVNGGHALAFHSPSDNSAFSTMNSNNAEGLLSIYAYSSKGSGFWTFGYDRITNGYYGQENPPTVAFLSDIDSKVSAAVAGKVSKTGDTLTGYYVVPYSSSGGNAFTFGDVSSNKFTNLLSDANGNMNFYTPSGSWVFGNHTATTPDGYTVITSKELDPSTANDLASIGASVSKLKAIARDEEDNAKLSQSERSQAQPIYSNLSITNLFNWTGGTSQNSNSVQNPNNDPNYNWKIDWNPSNAQYNNDDFTAAGGGFYVTADSSAMPDKLKGMPFYANFQYQLNETQDTSANASGKYNHHLRGYAVLHVNSGGFDDSDNALTGANAPSADYKFGTTGRIETPLGATIVAEDFTSGYQIAMASSFDSDKADVGGTPALGNFKNIVGNGNGNAQTKTQWGTVKVNPSKTNGGWATFDFPEAFATTPTVTLSTNYFMNTSSGVTPIPAGTNVYLGEVTNTSFAVTVVDKDGNQTSISDIVTVNFNAIGF